MGFWLTEQSGAKDAKTSVSFRWSNSKTFRLDANYREREREKLISPLPRGGRRISSSAFSKSAPFRILSPHSKLWYHICSQVVK